MGTQRPERERLTRVSCLSKLSSKIRAGGNGGALLSLLGAEGGACNGAILMGGVSALVLHTMPEEDPAQGRSV
jgi:hypothetical protein